MRTLKTMQHYEYAQIYVAGSQMSLYTPQAGAVTQSGLSIVELMNRLGREGWELVSSTATVAPGASVASHFFKRVRS
jgi:hypothetical protein